MPKKCGCGGVARYKTVGILSWVECSRCEASTKFGHGSKAAWAAWNKAIGGTEGHCGCGGSPQTVAGALHALVQCDTCGFMLVVQRSLNAIAVWQAAVSGQEPKTAAPKINLNREYQTADGKPKRRRGRQALF